MKIKSFPTNQPRTGPLLAPLLICAVAIVLFAILDSFYKEVTIAPLFGIILVFGLSLRYPPQSVFVCFFPVLLYTIVSLVRTPAFDLSAAESVVRLCVRVLTFCVAGLLATIASFFRMQLAKMLGQTMELLGVLPVAVILSDSGGRVVWVNSAAQSILGTKPAAGRLYLDVLPSDGTPVNYHALFLNAGSVQSHCNIVPNHELKFARIRSGRFSLLATILLKKSN